MRAWIDCITDMQPLVGFRVKFFFNFLCFLSHSSFHAVTPQLDEILKVVALESGLGISVETHFKKILYFLIGIILKGGLTQYLVSRNFYLHFPRVFPSLKRLLISKQKRLN